MTEQELLVDCLRRLNRLRVPYMLTGSMASNFWGIPRTTHDLDFVIQLLPEAAARIAHEFEDGFFIDEEAVRQAVGPPHMFNAVDRRSALKVDFWILGSSAFERSMFDRRLAQALFGEAAWIPTAEDVILHKLYWHGLTPSERQLGDAAGVVAVQTGALDLAYLRLWGTRLGVTETLEALLAGRIRPKST
jgi:hypothetical protein